MQICAFCLRPAKMSREHVWSAWVENLYPVPKRRYSLKTLTTENSYKEWKSRTVDMTAKVVCEECNNTWMSDLEENYAKPAMAGIIRSGVDICLLPAGVRAISAFAFKTAVIADHNRPRSKPFFSHHARRNFARSLQIPAGVQVWLGCFDSEYMLSGRLTTYYMQVRGGRFRGFEFYVLTYVVGHLVVQVTASRWISLAKRPAFHPQLTQNPLWGRRSVLLWPNSSVPWPPAETICDDNLDVSAKRWSKLTERVFPKQRSGLLPIY